jgi:hypothetical protein
MGEDDSRRKKARRRLIALGVSLLVGTPLVALLAVWVENVREGAAWSH